MRVNGVRRGANADDSKSIGEGPSGGRVEIEKMLDAGLPEKYTAELFELKCGVLFQHVLEKYPDRGRSVYGEAG